jgi:phage baseplate assembly protein W
MTTYLGFSTYNRVRKFTLTDFELVRQDLFNHFSIRKGEKLMNPKFGTVIWDLLFEPLTDDVRSIIVSDIKNVVNYDPRIEADNVTVTEYNHGIQIELELRYVLTSQVENLALRFDKATRTLTVAG